MKSENKELKENKKKSLSINDDIYEELKQERFNCILVKGDVVSFNEVIRTLLEDARAFRKSKTQNQ
jgi:predicted CopG family antitoxin